MADEEIDLRFERALRSENAEHGLGALMYTLKAEGMSQDEMFTLFDRHRAKHQNDADETDYDYIRDLMDLIVGWCAPEVQLYDPPPPPQKLGGADVLLWTNGRRELCMVEKDGTSCGIRAMAICRSPDRNGICLFRCFVEWTVVDATAHGSVNEAVAAATQWGIQPSDWHDERR